MSVDAGFGVGKGEGSVVSSETVVVSVAVAKSVTTNVEPMVGDCRME